MNNKLRSQTTSAMLRQRNLGYGEKSWEQGGATLTAKHSSAGQTLVQQRVQLPDLSLRSYFSTVNLKRSSVRTQLL